MNKKNKGIHIIGDLYRCDLKKFCLTKKNLKVIEEIISREIKKHFLTELGSCYHFFSKNAVTGVVALAESHISFHTWPEDDYVSLDVFVCNFFADNTPSAEKIFLYLAQDFFKSKRIKKVIIKR